MGNSRIGKAVIILGLANLTETTLTQMEKALRKHYLDSIPMRIAVNYSAHDIAYSCHATKKVVYIIIFPHRGTHLYVVMGISNHLWMMKPRLCQRYLFRQEE